MSTGTTTTVSADDVRRYAADPMEFFSDVRLVAGGPPFGSIMADFQRDFLLAVAPCLLAVAHREVPPKRGIWFEAVKGAGKDSLCSLALLWLIAFSGRNVYAQIGADDQAQASEVKRAAADWLRANPWLEARVEILASRIDNPTTGSTCDVLTTDAASAHGARPDLLVINEVSHIGSEPFALTLADNATKMPGALCLFATNAGTLNSWAFRWRELYREDPRWHFQKVTTPPPWQSPADIEEARRRNPSGRFRRLYGGEWVPETGDALDPGDIRAAVTLAGPTWKRPLQAGAVIGLDLGVKRDHAALVLLLTDHKLRRIRVAHVESWAPSSFIGGQVDLEMVWQSIVWAYRTYAVKLLMYDPWQCEWAAQKARAMGMSAEPMTFGGEGATRMASTLLEVFRSRMIDLYDDRDLLRDLERLSIQERPGGGYKLIAPRDAKLGHADRAMALAMALPVAWQGIGEVVVVDQPEQSSPPTPRAMDDRRDGFHWRQRYWAPGE